MADAGASWLQYLQSLKQDPDGSQQAAPDMSLTSAYWAPVGQQGGGTWSAQDYLSNPAANAYGLTPQAPAMVPAARPRDMTSTPSLPDSSQGSSSPDASAPPSVSYTDQRSGPPTSTASDSGPTPPVQGDGATKRQLPRLPTQGVLGQIGNM